MEVDLSLEPLGLSFNNFSFRNMFNKVHINPYQWEMDKQYRLRLQASRTYSTYSFSFTEPWLGGRKPKSLSFSIYSSNQFNFNPQTFEVDRDQSLGYYWSYFRFRTTFKMAR